MIPIEEQIACVAREIALRRNVYPKWVANGRMKQPAADTEIARMEAVIATLKDVQLYRDLIKALELPPEDVAACVVRLLKAQQD